DLVLLGAFERERFAYLGHDEVAELGRQASLTVVDALSPRGEDLDQQIQDLLSSLAGADQEGAGLCFERPPPAGVIYRVKGKSPEYLQLMRLMAFCTYERTVELIDADPAARTWEGLRSALQEQGRDRVPEEVLVFYRQHLERFQAYLAALERLRQWAEESCRRIDAEIGGREGREPAAYRKAFAAKAVRWPHSGLLFAALDGRLN